MNDKLLIDRALLEDALIDLESGMMCNPSAETLQQLRAQLAAIQQAKGEAVEVVGVVCVSRFKNNPAIENVEFQQAADIPQGQHDVMTVAQHQRITAAMAAEVETWKGMTKEAHEYHSAAMIELARILGGDVSDEPRLKWVCGIAIDVVSERDALRAELAAVKGQEPFIYAHELLDVGGGVWLGCKDADSVRKSHIPGQTGDEVIALYALPPASPDVEGLVKALEVEFPLLDDNGLDETLHHCEWAIQQERKRLHAALSTWRQGQDKP